MLSLFFNIRGWIEHLEGLDEKDIILMIADHKISNEKKSMICGVYVFLKLNRRIDCSYHNVVSSINGFIAFCGYELDSLMTHKYYVQCVRLKRITAYIDALNLSYDLISQHTELDEMDIISWHKTTSAIPSYYMTVLLDLVEIFDVEEKVKENLGKLNS